MRALPLAFLLTVAALAGCIDTDSTDPLVDEGTEAEEPLRPTVVAVIDSGINPYHDLFQSASPPDAATLALLSNSLDGESPISIQLNQTGDYKERRAADEAVWNETIQPHKLYHFAGTNVLGISFVDDEDNMPILDDGTSHGTGTSAAVLTQDPNLIVVLVEGIRPDSEAWAASQPWIDVISMSYGPPGSIPGSGDVLFGMTTYESTKLMWANGKLPIGASDNSPALAPTDETAGPPWVIGVAGDHPNDCREDSSGTAPDFTSDFTQELPRADDTEETRPMSGTSFATPKTAGSFASALREMRERFGAPSASEDAATLSYGPDNASLTNADYRRVFENHATYLETSATCGPGTVNPAAPWVQQGWGHVGPEIVPDVVAELAGDVGDQSDKKPQQAREHQARVMLVRETVWGSG